MCLWRSTFLVKSTLFFFAAMLLCNPVYAQQGILVESVSMALPKQSDFPVMYVSAAESQQLARQFERKGYVVLEGTLAQLEALTKTVSQEKQKEPIVEEGSKNKECKEKTREKILKDKECKAEKAAGDEGQFVEGGPQPQLKSAGPASEPVPPHEHPSGSKVQASVGLHLNVSGGSGGGNNSDFSRVFFIFVGIAVVAAFVVYAGKYIADIAGGKHKKLWRELIFNTTFLSTKPGRHGQFLGAKMATGFVSDDLIQLALVGELGNTNLDLLLNEDTDPTPLNFSATYWMLGATARLHLTATLKNASYLYLEFMGGTTSRSATGIIGAARVGASFGLKDNWRLGASLGAQYIGLDESQGFSNDGENYWLTYGVEVGARF